MNEIEIKLKASIEVNSTPEKEYAQVLLRKATMFKKEGMFDDAVATLKQAYDEIAKTNTDFTIETFLRLPAYLQSAGRAKEAWAEFEKLLAKKYPNEFEVDWVRELTRAKVFDKMRLHLQREKNAIAAVRYGALAYVAELRAEHLRPKDSRNSSFLQERMQPESIEKYFNPLLKKTKSSPQLPTVVRIVRAWLSELPQANDSKYAAEIDATVQA